MKAKSLLVLSMLCSLLIGLDIHAQEIEHTAWEVYVRQDIDNIGTDELQFVNLLSGEVNTTTVNGERYTPLGNYLMYFDHDNRNVMAIEPDGTITSHPFIQRGEARRIDWIVSSDHRIIAWTLTYGEANNLTTVTSVSSPAGTNQDVVLSDGPRTDGARVLPVAFSYDNSALILDSQPDGIGDLAPYRQFASLFSLSLIDGTINPLPGEPGCFCAAALRAGHFLRLAITNDFSGFDVHFYDLDTNDFNVIASPGLVNYTQGGDILISPDGRLAVYALSQVELASTENTVRTIIMLVNLETFTQEQLSQPINAYINPKRWTEDNTSILFTMSQSNGTWKIDLVNRELERIASASYIGVLEN